jgi:hypothetical protein
MLAFTPTLGLEMEKEKNHLSPALSPEDGGEGDERREFRGSMRGGGSRREFAHGKDENNDAGDDVQRGGGGCVLHRFRDGQQQIQSLPDYQRLRIGRRLGAGPFVDEPGNGEDNERNGGDDARAGREPVVGVPVENIQAGIEHEDQRAGEADAPQSVVGRVPPRLHDEPGDAARIQDGHNPGERSQPGIEDFGVGCVQVSEGRDEAARFGAGELGEFGKAGNDHNRGQNILRGQRSGQIEQSCGSRKTERGNDDPGAGELGRMKQQTREAGRRTGEERGETKSMYKLRHAPVWRAVGRAVK